MLSVKEMKARIFDKRVYTKSDEWTAIEAALIAIEGVEGRIDWLSRQETHYEASRRLVKKLKEDGLESDPYTKQVAADITAYEEHYPDGFDAAREKLQQEHLEKVRALREPIMTQYPNVPVSVIADDDLESIALTLTFNPESPFLKAMKR